MGPASSPGTGRAGTNTTCLQQWTSAVSRYRLDRKKLPRDKNKRLQLAMLSARGRTLFCEDVNGWINSPISYDFKNDSVNLEILALWVGASWDINLGSVHRLKGCQDSTVWFIF